MKKVFFILFVLLSVSAISQPRFFVQQFDNSVHFGANLQGLSAQEEIVGVRDSLHYTWVRHAVSLSGYVSGIDNGLKQRIDGGLRVAMNINWAQGSAPRNFPNASQLSGTYTTKLTTFLEDNATLLKDCIVVIENEPYNGTFYNYDNSPPFMTVGDYINELNVAVAICRSHNVKVVDGATHFQLYHDIMNPPVTGNAARRDDTALTQYASVKMNWANYHFNVPFANMSDNSTMDPNIIDSLCTYGTGRMGHNYISNEWHQEDQGTPTDQNNLAASIVTRTRQAHVRVAIMFGGSGVSDALIIYDTNTLSLTALGRAYRDAVLSGD